MTPETIAAVFDEWWRESYSNPPGGHAVMTHVAFGQHLIELFQLTQPITDDNQ